MMTRIKQKEVRMKILGNNVTNNSLSFGERVRVRGIYFTEFQQNITTTIKRSLLNSKGLSPIYIIAAILILIALFTAIFLFIKQNQSTPESTATIPPGIVTDNSGQICETQDPTYCHESPDIETWKDDELP